MTVLNRREFGLGAVATLGALALQSCDGGGAEPRRREAEAKASKRGFIEPTVFVDRVRAGKLPPIDERMPEEAFVVGPGVLLQKEYMTWSNGRFGGTITNSPTFPTGNMNIAGGATILRSPSQTTEVSLPNVVSQFSASDDYRSFQFTIRRGLKWSDGTDVTTEDVRFTFEDLYMDPQANRPWPTQLYTQGNFNLPPAKLKVVDDYSFELTFSRPYGYFVADLNSWIPGYDFILKPAHYFKQFHVRHAKKAELNELLKKEKLDSWVELLATKDVTHWDSGEASAFGMPVLHAWVLTEVTEDRRVFERNPYFWHVDSDGRQLPYIDSVVNGIVVDTDALTNAVMDGQVTIAAGDDITLNNMAVYKQHAERSGRRVFTTGSFNWPPQLFLNHDYEYDVADSSWHGLVADPDQRFGRAIAAALNPDEINESVYFGLHGKPMLNNKSHDPALANQLLDEVGMGQRDGDGFRLGPDGRPFTLRITHSTITPEFSPVAELVKEQVDAVGVRTQIKAVDSELFGQRSEANQLMASIHWNDGPAWSTGVSEDYLPGHKGPWSPLTWTYVTSNGKEGRKPPAYIQRFYDLHTARKQFPPESPDGKRLFGELMQWFEHYYVLIPTTGLRVKPNVVDARVQNVPNEGAPFELDTIINFEAMWFGEE
jgi:peptide/nickel transport system substrate-binding protein